MAAASPSLQELLADSNPTNQSVLNAIGANSSPAVRLALGALGYNQVAVAVNFPQQPNNVGATLQTRFTRRQSLTTRVTYLFHCGVPIVAAMACDDAPALVSGVPIRQIAQASRAIGLTAPEIRARLDAVNSARERLRRANWGLLSRELDATAAGSGVASAFLLALRGNFSVIRAEATLPLQDHQAPRLARACFNPSR